MAAIVLSLLAEKGGVGRTTTSLSLVRALAERYRVLCIDADKQGTVSKTYLGSVQFEKLPRHRTVAELIDLDGDPDPEEVILPTKIPNLFCIAASRDLRYHIQLDANTPDQARFGLRNFVHEVAELFDFVHIDTPPDIHSLPTWNALVASNAVLTVVQPEAYSVQGLPGGELILREVVRDNPGLRSLGYVVNQKRRLAVHTMFETQLRNLHNDQVFTTVLEDLKEIKEAAAGSQSVIDYAPKCKASKIVHEFCDELISRLKRMGFEPGNNNRRRKAA